MPQTPIRKVVVDLSTPSRTFKFFNKSIDFTVKYIFIFILIYEKNKFKKSALKVTCKYNIDTYTSSFNEMVQ